MSFIEKPERSIALVAACLNIDSRLVVHPEAVDPRALDPALLRSLPGKIRLAAVGDNTDALLRRVEIARPGDTIIVVPADGTTADIWSAAIHRALGIPLPSWFKKLEAVEP
jgi:hypothetical protein